MKRKAIRNGGSLRFSVFESAPSEIDSSQGRATTAPAPRNRVRRESFLDISVRTLLSNRHYHFQRLLVAEKRAPFRLGSGRREGFPRLRISERHTEHNFADQRSRAIAIAFQCI